MPRPVLRLLAALAAVVVVFGAGYELSCRLCSRMTRPADDLEWLRTEFRLSESEMARVRELHAGYLPRCRRWCEQIADRRGELDRLLAINAGMTTAAEEKLVEIAALRARCQADMLRHFDDVSRAMPPAQGSRYLAEMRRLTLGAHEEIEHEMTPAPVDPHGAHRH